MIEAAYPWEDALKSIEELRNRQDRGTPDRVADSVAGQNILVDLRISELLDTATRPNPSSWRLTRQRSSVLKAMCGARRSTVCRLAVTSDTWIGAASTLEIAPSKGW